MFTCADDVHSSSHDRNGEPPTKKRKKHSEKRKDSQGAKDEEFGVTRGIDFKGVHTVINYDVPASVQGYVHRVGRTGRGGQEGAALTLFTPEDDAIR